MLAASSRSYPPAPWYPYKNTCILTPHTPLPGLSTSHESLLPVTRALGPITLDNPGWSVALVLHEKWLDGAEGTGLSPAYSLWLCHGKKGMLRHLHKPEPPVDRRKDSAMTQSEFVRVFDSQGEDYKRAFQVFLDSTDQKRNAKRFLQRLVDDLPARKVFIDAGAGTGEVTKAFAPTFDRTIAIEPNAHLLAQLQRAIPQADAIGTSILDASPEAQGDFVLCSHTLYYIPADEWLAHLERLVSWMSPTGVTVVVLQNRGTDCMTMLQHFFGHRFDLGSLADAFRAKHGDHYEVSTTLDQAHVETSEQSAACTVAEFMLNLLPISQPPVKRDLDAYVAKHFATTDGAYRLSVHQDFLQIRERQ